MCMTKPINTTNKLFSVSKPVAVGDYVLDQLGNRHKLISQLGRTGGEGSVYETDSGYAAKIYKSEKNTFSRYKKIQSLIQIDNHLFTNVALAKSILFNDRREPVGYIMAKAKGTPLKTSVMIPQLLKTKFAHFQRIDLVKIARNITKTVEQLHKNGVIIGDINPSNILITNKADIFFIDTDSFQVSGIPCPVGMVPYTRVMHHGKPYDSYLRTVEDDTFALMTLVFQILFPGKLPYSFSGGGSEKENMHPQNFPYKCPDEPKAFSKVPDGTWVYIWSHLPKKLKLLFCQTFKNDTLPPIEKIVKRLNQYIYQIEQGYQSNEIFPKGYKEIDAQGRVIVGYYKTMICKQCKKEFGLTSSEVRFYDQHGKPYPTLCKVCRSIKKKHTQKSKETGVRLRCCDCHNEFTLTKGEMEFYTKKALSLPKRCKTCRKNKRRY